MREAEPSVGCARQALGSESQAIEKPTFQWTWELKKDNGAFFSSAKYFSSQLAFT